MSYTFGRFFNDFCGDFVFAILIDLLFSYLLLKLLFFRFDDDLLDKLLTGIIIF